MYSIDIDKITTFVYLPLLQGLLIPFMFIILNKFIYPAISTFAVQIYHANKFLLYS